MSGCPFDVGDVVVCVDASPRDIPCFVPINHLLAEGGQYRISDIVDHGDDRDGWSLLLCGVPVPDPMDGFNYRRFRKIDDGVTDKFRHQMRSIGKRSTVPA